MINYICSITTAIVEVTATTQTGRSQFFWGTQWKIWGNQRSCRLQGALDTVYYQISC